ncbi:hypothetical protein BH18ACI4_BH18ACI4_04180 [soil metagenome]
MRMNFLRSKLAVVVCLSAVVLLGVTAYAAIIINVLAVGTIPPL